METLNKIVRLMALSLSMLAGALFLPPFSSGFAKTVEIRMTQSADGNSVYFDPIGIQIEAGDTVRWIQISNYHSVTAYHPKNDNHELRIPEQAEPWDSGVLVGTYPGPNSSFEHKFTVEGVYDYFCRPHEQAGMVGRIIVGKPLDGPGIKPFGYAPEKKWKVVPKAAQMHFPSVEEIMAKGVVRLSGAQTENGNK